MKIRDVIDSFRRLHGDGMDNAMLMVQLSRLDLMVAQDIYAPYPELRRPDFGGYGCDTDADTELLVPEPYGGIYTEWLSMCLYAEQQETEAYNDALQRFYALRQGLADWVTRNHMPPRRPIRLV